MSETYPYEQLDGRRFQLLAQSLFTAEHPNVQCFPLSGPDGGRDAVGMSLRTTSRSLKDGHVYQVKFREQNPVGVPTTDDLYRWVIGNLKSELPNVRKLAKRGAELFTFVTNVPATGHLDAGLRDRVQEWVNAHLPIPTSIWWREDLDARLSRHADLIFRFALFRGIDSVRAYFQSLLPASSVPSVLSGVAFQPSHPGVSTMVLYLSKQYEAEASLRFKQVEIDPIPVLKHFVDTPVVVQQRGQDAGYIRELLASVDPDIDASDNDVDVDGHPVKVARLFLNDRFVDGFRKVVLEGAPGQGKTTLVQYIGQIHRARILDRLKDLSDVPAELKTGPLRLPIRIELRHLGSWLQGESPWAAHSNEAQTPTYPSIQSFISAHAAYSTGGLELTANDVIAIIAKTPTLLMLDGLDEVPDAEVRARVVELAESFINDLQTFGADVQVIVTSRPSASSKTAVFSRQGFKYLKLADLTGDEIWEYAEDWISRKKIADHDAHTFKNVLAECLQKQHVADLARNPMQLAILLWLVHVRDWSLPDKRTALYEQYMSTFLDRESTKEPIVREHRTVLLELHSYIAWVLHARSEHDPFSGSGDISKSELKQLMREYLESQEEEDVDQLIDVLFRGVQRVFALTERIQGRFEFEIQSMREYFAGTFLYKTAPHYSNVSNVFGSRPDRLEALIRNPYWLNVVRFFCGWYDKGELADLSRRLVDLCDDPTYRHLAHPRELIASLLGDHVTLASKRDTRQLAEQLTDALSLRAVGRILKGDVVSTPIPPNGVILPAMAKQAQIVYPEARPDELVYELSAIIRSQIEATDRFTWWRELRPAIESSSFSTWLRSGSILQAFCGAPIEDLPEALNLDSGASDSWIRGFEAGRLDAALTRRDWLESFLDRLAAGNAVLSHPDNPEGRFIYEVYQLLSSDFLFWRPRRPSEATLRVPERHPQYRAELAAFTRLFDLFPGELASYSQALSFGREVHSTLGSGCWSSWRFPLLLAPVLSSASSRDLGFTRPIVSCWEKRNDLGFWAEFIENESIELMPRVATFMAWAPAQAFVALCDEVSSKWELLHPWQMPMIQRCLSLQHVLNEEDFAQCRFTTEDFQSLPESLPGCMLPTLESRYERKNVTPNRGNAYTSCLRHESIDLAYRTSQVINTLGRGKVSQLEADLSRIRSMFPKMRADISEPLPKAVATLYRPKKLPARFVEAILSSPFDYPYVLVDAAQQAATGRMVGDLPSLAEISKKEKWFG
ncbi:NACHT domain-containing protein [Streptomyces massasporeus]